MNSSISGGAGTMAENVVAGSVPMATATSKREPFILPSATCGRPPTGPSGMVTAPPADSAIAATRADFSLRPPALRCYGAALRRASR